MDVHTRDKEWQLAVGTGVTRVVAGLALFRWRRPLMRMAGAAEGDRVVGTLFAYFGIRDLALGMTTLAASRPDGDVSTQLALQGAADATDAVLLRRAVRRGRLVGWRGHGTVALAAATAVVDVAALAQLHLQGRHANG